MTDYVSREEVLKLAKRGVIVSNGNYSSVVSFINEIPSADVVERELYERALSDVVELSVKRKTGKWIPVTERLPEDYEQVLTCDERGNIHMFSHNRLFKYPFGIKPENPRYFMPKWWMPLPEPPEEKI